MSFQSNRVLQCNVQLPSESGYYKDIAVTSKLVKSLKTGELVLSFACPICIKTYERPESLQRHVKFRHHLPKVEKCEDQEKRCNKEGFEGPPSSFGESLKHYHEITERDLNKISSAFAREIPEQQIRLLAQIPEFRNVVSGTKGFWLPAFKLTHHQEKYGCGISVLMGVSEEYFFTYVEEAITRFSEVLRQFSFTTRVQMRGSTNEAGGKTKKPVTVPKQKETITKYSRVVASLVQFAITIAFVHLEKKGFEQLPEDVKGFIKTHQLLLKLWNNNKNPSSPNKWDISTSAQSLIKALRKYIKGNNDNNSNVKDDDDNNNNSNEKDIKGNLLQKVDSRLARLIVSLLKTETSNIEGGCSLVQFWLSLTQMNEKGELLISTVVTQDLSAIIYCFFAAFSSCLKTDGSDDDPVEMSNQRVLDGIKDFQKPCSTFSQLIALRALVRFLGDGSDRMPSILWRDEDKLIFQIEEDILSLSTLQEVYSKLLSDMSELLFKDLLFGVCDDWLPLNVQVNLRDNLASIEPNASIVSQNEILQMFYNNFKDKLFKNKTFIKQWVSQDKSSGKVSYSSDLVNNYQHRVERFMKLLLAAGKLTEGLPSRASEQIDWTWINENTRKRTIFMYQGRLGLIAGYNKTRSTSFREKVIARFYPLELTRLVLLYYSISIKFQQFLMHSAHLCCIEKDSAYAKSEKEIEVITRNAVMETTFSSISGKILFKKDITLPIMESISIAHRVSGEVNPTISERRRLYNESVTLPKFGVRKIRQVIIGLMRLLDNQDSIQDPNVERLANEINNGGFDDEEDDIADHDNTLVGMRAAQAGHSRLTHNICYGVGGTHTSQISTESLRSFFATSLRWHTRMGADKKYLVSADATTETKVEIDSPFSHQASLQILPLQIPSAETNHPLIPAIDKSECNDFTQSIMVSDKKKVSGTGSLRSVRFDLEPQQPSNINEEVKLLDYMRAMLKKDQVCFRSDHQRQAVLTMLHARKNMFYHATTSGGKTFAALLVVYIEQSISDARCRSAKNMKTTVFIVPFTLLRTEILNTAQKFNIDAVVYSEVPAVEYMNKSLIIASTVQAVSNNFREMLIFLNTYNLLQRIIVDEAHEVTVSSSYRAEMQNLDALRADPLHQVPMCSMSATVPFQETEEMLRNLGCTLADTEIVRSPNCNRPNLQFIMIYNSEGITTENKLHQLICSWMKEEYGSNKKMIVYFPYRDMLEKTYQTYLSDRAVNNLLPEEVEPSQFFKTHFNTEGCNKEANWIMFQQPKGYSRILFATNGAGAGVNAPNINCVIEYGVGSSIPLSIQKFGRACRENDAEIGKCYVITNDNIINQHRRLIQTKRKDLKNNLALFEKWVEWVTFRHCYRAYLIKYMDEPSAWISECSIKDAKCSFCFRNVSTPTNPIRWMSKGNNNYVCKVHGKDETNDKNGNSNSNENNNNKSSSNDKNDKNINQHASSRGQKDCTSGNDKDDDDDGEGDEDKIRKKLKTSHEIDERDLHDDNNDNIPADVNKKASDAPVKYGINSDIYSSNSSNKNHSNGSFSKEDNSVNNPKLSRMKLVKSTTIVSESDENYYFDDLDFQQLKELDLFEEQHKSNKIELQKGAPKKSGLVETPQKAIHEPTKTIIDDKNNNNDNNNNNNNVMKDNNNNSNKVVNDKCHDNCNPADEWQTRIKQNAKEAGIPLIIKSPNGGFEETSLSLSATHVSATEKTWLNMSKKPPTESLVNIKKVPPIGTVLLAKNVNQDSQDSKSNGGRTQTPHKKNNNDNYNNDDNINNNNPEKEKSSQKSNVVDKRVDPRLRPYSLTDPELIKYHENKNKRDNVNKEDEIRNKDTALTHHKRTIESVSNNNLDKSNKNHKKRVDDDGDDDDNDDDGRKSKDVSKDKSNFTDNIKDLRKRTAENQIGNSRKKLIYDDDDDDDFVTNPHQKMLVNPLVPDANGTWDDPNMCGVCKGDDLKYFHICFNCDKSYHTYCQSGVWSEKHWFCSKKCESSKDSDVLFLGVTPANVARDIKININNINNNNNNNNNSNNKIEDYFENINSNSNNNGNRNNNNNNNENKDKKDIVNSSNSSSEQLTQFQRAMIAVNSVKYRSAKGEAAKANKSETGDEILAYNTERSSNKTAVMNDPRRDERLQIPTNNRITFKQRLKICLDRFCKEDSSHGRVPCPLCYINGSEFRHPGLQDSCKLYGDRCFACLDKHKAPGCPGKPGKLSKYMSGTCCFDCSLPEKDPDYHTNHLDKSGGRRCIYSRDAIRKLSMATYQLFSSLIWSTFFKKVVIPFENYWLWTYQVDNGSQDDFGARGFLNMVKVFVLIVEKHINDERNNMNNNNNDDDDDDDDDDDSSDEDNNHHNGNNNSNIKGKNNTNDNKNKHRNNLNDNNYYNNNNNKHINNNRNNNKNHDNNCKYNEKKEQINEIEAAPKQHAKFKELFTPKPNPAPKSNIVFVPIFRGNKDSNNNNKDDDNNNGNNTNDNNNNNMSKLNKTRKKGF